MKLKEQIYNLRSARGMSQGELADALDVSRQSVSKWETGASIPELDKLVSMSALFGVTLDELVTGIPPAPAEAAPAKPDWSRLTGLVLFSFAGISLIVTVLFANQFGIHTHQGLALAALFVLLGIAAIFHSDSRIYSLCLRLYGGAAGVLLALSSLLTGLWGFAAAYMLVLLLWRCHIRRLDADKSQ